MPLPHSVPDTISMAEAAVAEIEGLRRVNAELAPKAEAYDLLKQVLGLLPQRSQGAGEDIVWKLRRRVDELRDMQTKPENPEKDS